jgi:hypothetical protein
MCHDIRRRDIRRHHGSAPAGRRDSRRSGHRQRRIIAPMPSTRRMTIPENAAFSMRNNLL